MKEIARAVGCTLSSVSHWTRDISLTPEQCAALRSRNPAINGQLVAAANASRARARRVAFQEEGRRLAHRGDRLHVAGCMLYWAEGSKSRNSVQFVNSDPEMVRYFVTFLRAHFAVPDEKLRLDCNLFADHIERQLTEQCASASTPHESSRASTDRSRSTAASSSRSGSTEDRRPPGRGET